MNASSAVRELREHGVDVEQWLGVDATTLTGWEEERALPSRLQLRRLEWLVGQAENERLLAQAGLPGCPARGRLEAELAALTTHGKATTTQIQNAVDTLIAHADACATCSANRDWERRNLRDLGPFPMPGAQGVVNAVAARVPRALLPALLGAMFLGAIVGMRVGVAIVVLVLRDPSVQAMATLIREAVPAVLAAAMAGAAGGLILPVVRPTLRRMGAVGDYLTGILMVDAYMVALALLAPVAFGETLVTNSADWMLFLGVGAFFGVVGAFAYRRNQKQDARARAV